MYQTLSEKLSNKSPGDRVHVPSVATASCLSVGGWATLCSHRVMPKSTFCSTWCSGVAHLQVQLGHVTPYVSRFLEGPSILAVTTGVQSVSESGHERLLSKKSDRIFLKPDVRLAVSNNPEAFLDISCATGNISHTGCVSQREGCARWRRPCRNDIIPSSIFKKVIYVWFVSPFVYVTKDGRVCSWIIVTAQNTNSVFVTKSSFHSSTD